ncbi:4Fe-4S dicluster domain-containing protein [Gaoshiqia sp. Z1-71]|uniref:4Fe-4S dicluster domain-containing protein n=1 Tax=Gaoshiqia hydrogeniformans TaxID=3290090 RepID=UPI003BF79EF1
MSIDRRNFFKTIGIAGMTIIGVNASASPASGDDEPEFHGILYDSNVCIGCRACENACAKAHGLPEPEDELKAGVLRKTSEKKRCVINSFNTSKGEIYARKQCMHCNEPACAAACLTQAMYKTKEGPVIWREEKCMGCRYCMISCPFDVPKFDYHSANPKIQKCDMCYERIIQGELPVCVETCGDALFFGTRRELIAEARRRIAETPELYIDQIYGERVAGGTGYLYLSPVPYHELGFNEQLQNSSYPALTKGFLYSVPAVFVLVPSLLLGIHEATKNKSSKNEDYD